ncbi:radical SAM protein [archaeon]|nr:radical SAM protein [archaeon]
MYILLGGIKPLVGEVLGKKATRLYLGGCNWKCGYCYVPEVLDEKKCQRVNLNECVYLLQQIKSMEAVEITGGEPTKQARELETLCRACKQEGWLVKVHSNGSNPGVIANLVTENLVDVLALDVKAPLKDEKMYSHITGCKPDPQKVRESLGLAHLSSFNGLFEVIVPVLPGITDNEETIRKICKDVSYCDSLVLRGFDPAHDLLNEKLKEEEAPSHDTLLKLAKVARDALYNVNTIMVESAEKGIETI